MKASGWAWALAGAAAAALAVGVGELFAAVLGGSSIVGAVGALVISLQPPGGKDLMVALFDGYDKAALEIMTGIGGLLVGGFLGLLARRDLRIANVGFLVFGVVAFVLIVQDPLPTPFSAAVGVVPAVLVGMFALTWFADLLMPGGTRAGLVTATAAASGGTAGAMPRRNFVALGVLALAAGGVMSVVSRFIGGSSSAEPLGPAPSIPPPQGTAPPLPAGADFSIDGLTPIVVPNADFYRIDTRLDTPRVAADTWSLRIHGMVDEELTLDYQELVAMPLISRYVTIACVSNEVGGHLVGNAKWTGTPLVPLLNKAGIQSGATQVVGRAFDGFTVGLPTEHLSGAGADAMVVVQMNDQPLPPQHGFPARLIVPGLYGYVSATKWLTEIELTTLEAFDAYWVPLGWSKLGPILTESRIDVPRFGANVAAGPVQVAGVAWAPTRGISKVEVQLDNSGWQPAELSVPISNKTWIQWRITVAASAGQHQLQVRATDGTGAVQTDVRSGPAPSGATGYHTITFSAT
jgi:DMSO/TMAO reductase YedYZ molybdopterin-dependent catalytic subunit